MSFHSGFGRMEAERAVRAACLVRLAALRSLGAPVLRGGKGLIFQSRRFRQACRIMG